MREIVHESKSNLTYFLACWEPLRGFAKRKTSKDFSIMVEDLEKWSAPLFSKCSRLLCRIWWPISSIFGPRLLWSLFILSYEKVEMKILIRLISKLITILVLSCIWSIIFYRVTSSCYFKDKNQKFLITKILVLKYLIIFV